MELDYAVPRYRDFEPGRFVYQKSAGFFETEGVSRFVTKTTNKTHRRYLTKMGFEPLHPKAAVLAKPLLEGR